MKYKKVADEFFLMAAELRKECSKHLRKVLKTQPAKRVLIDEEEIDNYELDVLTIAYDGGNHPEYDSNLFSRVESVELVDNEIYIHTEDGVMSEHYISVYDLFNVCEYVDNLILCRE